MLLWPCGVGEEQWCLLLRRCCSLALVCARAAAAHLRRLLMPWGRGEIAFLLVQ